MESDYTCKSLHKVTNGIQPKTYKRRNIGKIIFRPIEARLAKNLDFFGLMDPYCIFKIGWHKGKSSVAKNQGKHPIWAGDTVVLDLKHNEMFAKVKVKDKDRLSFDDKAGEAKIPLECVIAKGQVKQWYNLYYKNKISGAILLGVEFQPTEII